MATYKDLSFDEGNDFSYDITLTDENGDAIDLTGYTFYMTVKSKKSNSDEDSIFKITVSSIPSPELGIVTIPVTRDDTLNVPPGIYPYDIKYKTGSDSVRTVLIGNFQLIQGVTDDLGL